MELDDKTDALNTYAGVRAEPRREFEERFDISWIYHDNALEGVVLTSHEIKAAIDRKVISDVNLIPTYQEIKNQKAAIDYVREAAKNKRTRVNLTLVKDLHALFVRDIEGAEAGRYRKEIPLHRTYFHEIAQPNRISYRLNKLLQACGSSEFKRWHPINQAAAFHHEFMSIFAFPDNSGKVGRMLMNFFLLRASYMPAVIHSIDRQRYYESLRGPVHQLRELLIESMENGLDCGLRCLNELIARPTEYVQ